MKRDGYAFTGKAIRINLTSREIKVIDCSNDFKDWLGGSGYAAKMLFEETHRWITAYEPANLIIFSAGALLGTPAPGACKMSISTISPVTGGWATGSSDSYVGIELKNAGFDHVIVEGKSHNPCYLFITEEKIEIRDASFLWGLNTWETLDEIKNELHDENLHAISIGPAGENQVRGACIIQDYHRAFGRCGSGSVMGSKNLKAIVCKGKSPVYVADTERFMKCVQNCRDKVLNSPNVEPQRRYGTLSCLQPKQDMCAIPYKNFQDGKIPDEIAAKNNPMMIVDKFQVARQSFPGCAIGCGRFLEITEGPYAGLKTFAPQCEAVAEFQGKLAVEEVTFTFMANTICNQLGIDVDFVAGTIGWAIECFEKGILTKKDTAGLVLNWGDEKLILDLIKKITFREGFGNLLAEGVLRASNIIKRNSEYFAIHLKGQELYETLRGSNAWALGAITSTRGGGHTTGTPVYEQYDQMGPADAERMYKFFGIRDLDKPQKYEGKPELVFYFEILHRICNSVGICHFNTVWSNLDYINLEDVAELLSSATGIEFSTEKLKEIAMRQLNMEKAINLKCTNFSRKDDMPDERELNEPIKSGKLAGWKFNKQKLNKMLDHYYDLHGWDKETSYPTRATLEKYRLGYVADELEKIGKIGNSNKN